MSLPLPTTARVLKHTRTIQVQFFYRNDELWDIDAHFTDVKTHDLLLTSFVIPAKRPVHNLWLRLTINAQGTVVDAYVAFDDVPFEGYCERIHSRYRQLIGLNVLHHFRHELHERFKGILGCTHMNELAEAIPSVAMQAVSSGPVSLYGHRRAGSQKILPCLVEQIRNRQINCRLPAGYGRPFKSQSYLWISMRTSLWEIFGLPDFVKVL